VPRKSAGRGRRARTSQKAVAAGDGIVARALDRAFENPAMSGGLLVMALTATAIVSNAMFLQTGHHPEPLFASRPSMPLPKLAPGEPRVTKRQSGAAIAPPAPSLAPAAGGSETALVTDIQRELARLGLYVGSIDGIAGERTTAAIATYQAAAGRPATGVPSAELLDFIRNAPPPPAAGVTDTKAPSTTTLTERDIAAAPSADTYRSVQTALNRAGYGPIAVDGQPGNQTADAIRRFELDNGLPITGDIGERLLARLVAVGAMNPP
jgi:peptidoglycan hydrolase-like protein with peptidoglycan-binding domain